MKDIVSYRKIPTQARAKASVDAILEATAQILQQDGVGALTTNAIAEKAGVSIGTLYQYFPDKNAILIALARQELAETSQAVAAGVSGAEQVDEAVDPLRRGIQALLQGFHGRPRSRKALIEALIANGLSDELARPVDRVMPDILSAQAKTGELKPITAYVLTRAIIGAARAALMEESAYFGTKEFEDELVRMTQVLLTAPR
ncbi:TetR/AcrR family transcriptional regulator [Paracoccus aurantiacus]|uniref:TetR/AcrR family transcriptional regulator n=1 Tax=Paracoccus aurantiacus TaxID=2599412 RepID=A0A5C6RZ78_9RHOB|nr:TetR/AcrR family transcriptional regulator [Paracoccus aurantiacus]TXB67463.1 TetR/AcrR family transcriptional regulator [Paracoccus aurantiacus]